MFCYVVGGVLVFAGVAKLICCKHSHHQWMLKCAFRKISATDAQKAKLSALFEDTHERLRPVKEQLRLVHRELAEVIEADVLDSAKLEKLEARLFERIGEGTQVGREFVAKLHETLTPPQRSKVASWLRSSQGHHHCCKAHGHC